VNRQGSPPTSFAVNIDPAELDPVMITSQELQTRFGPHPLVVWETLESLGNTIQRLRAGTGPAEWFLAIVVVGLVLELILANRCGMMPTSGHVRPTIANAE
jgi:hypothetical protein